MTSTASQNNAFAKKPAARAFRNFHRTPVLHLRKELNPPLNNIERRDADIAYISDEAIFAEQKVCRRLLQRLNTADADDFETHRAIVSELLGASENASINPPFYCDYGTRIRAGKNLFINYNCTIIDTAIVTIGDNCLFAPNVSLYTAGHPLHPVSRNSLYEFAKPINIGDNVWLGGGVTVLPGVTIGSNSVIGAGSVVTRDIPPWSLAAGNPCRVLRRITEADKPFFYKNERFDSEAWKDILAYEAELKKPKIAVVGYAGSGKSMLAQALAEKYDVPLQHLDCIHWLPGWQERPRGESRSLLRTFMDSHYNWVIDGNYHNLLYARRMAEADRIILLEFDRAACLARAVKRALRYHGKCRASIGEGCPEKMDREFADWILYKGRTPQHIARWNALKKRYPDKVTVITDQRELDAFYQKEGLRKSREKIR